jgi:CHASE2 domain-containing sensor protein
MKFQLMLISRLRKAIAAFFTLLARRWKNSFYLYLAVFFTLLALADTAFLHVTANMRQTTFDMMMRYRIMVAKPDPDIVIVDSRGEFGGYTGLWALAMAAPKWGVYRLAQQPSAVVFDVLLAMQMFITRTALFMRRSPPPAIPISPSCGWIRTATA